MDSKRYWRKRQLEREKHWYDLTTAKLNDEVRIYYQQSLEKIQRDIAALYARFGAENKLSPAEARRLIRGDEFTVWRMTLEEYVKAAKGDSAILKELNTLAMRSRISRFEALHARTLMELADLCEKLERFEDAFQYRAYIANYYGNLYDIHKQYGLSTPPVAVDKNQAEKVVRTAWSGANYSKRIWKNGAKLESAIKETMLTAIHRGASIQKLSTDLSRRMQVGYNDAERLIRTELNYVQTRAAADSIISAEMGYYQFIAVMDNRTTPMCQSLDGEIFPIIELSQGENAPPMHVRCRSTIAASEDDGRQGRKPVGQRAARDEEGKRIKIPADMTYRDWKAVYIDKTRTLEDWRKAKDAEYAAAKPKVRTKTDIRADYKKQSAAVEKAYNDFNAAQMAPFRATYRDDLRKAHQDWVSELQNLRAIQVEGAKKKVMFASGLEKAYSADDIAKIFEFLEDAPEDIRVLWNTAERSMEVLSTNYTKGAAHYSPTKGGINIDLYKDTIANPAKYKFKAYTTTFHELGHMIDHWLNGGGANFYSQEYKSGLFGATLKREAEKCVADNWKRLKAEAKVAGKSVKDVKKADAYAAVEKEIRSLTFAQKHAVSDIFGGATSLKVEGGWGHSAKYWRGGDNLPLEAFAEMFQATINNAESLAQIKKYFPDSYKIFEEMISDFVKNL